MKIQITEKQLIEFNRMRSALIKISKEYQSTDQLRRNCERQYGLDFEECIEMVYDNIQAEARISVKGIKALTPLIKVAK
jgi:hypothetical protein